MAHRWWMQCNFACEGMRTVPSFKTLRSSLGNMTGFIKSHGLTQITIEFMVKKTYS